MIGRKRTSAGGFTLVELLVVIGIIAILFAVLMPVLGRVRASGHRTVCLAQLRDLGHMVQMYLRDNQHRVMRVNPVPSDPSLIPYPAPGIVEVLAPYHRGAVRVFRCPSDRLVGRTNVPPGTDTFFETDGTSYEYNAFFNSFAFDEQTGINKVWTDALADARKRAPLFPAPDELPLLMDFEAFHGPRGKLESRNALYADFRAAPLALKVRPRQRETEWPE
jgi:prepilin-type N-terminal cleavage/methylation domain-containing protein